MATFLGVVEMKKIFIACSLISLSLFANAGSNSASQESNYSIAAGFSGAKIDFKDVDGKEKLKGFFINGATAINPNISLYAEYANQKVEKLKFNEVSLGAQYKFYNDTNIYASAGVGVGYVWLDETLHNQDMGVSADLKLNYLSLPMQVEAGYKITDNISSYGSLGYKWLFNQDSEVCIYPSRGNSCESLNNNADGFTYKVGLRYAF